MWNGSIAQPSARRDGATVVGSAHIACLMTCLHSVPQYRELTVQASHAFVLILTIGSQVSLGNGKMLWAGGPSTAVADAEVSLGQACTLVYVALALNLVHDVNSTTLHLTESRVTVAVLRRCTMCARTPGLRQVWRMFAIVCAHQISASQCNRKGGCDKRWTPMLRRAYGHKASLLHPALAARSVV